MNIKQMNKKYDLKMYLWVFAHHLWANKSVHLSELCDPKHHGPPIMYRPAELSIHDLNSSPSTIDKINCPF